MTEDDSGTESSSVIQLRALVVLRTPTLGVTCHVRCCAPPPALRAGVLLRTACGGRPRSAKSLRERSSTVVRSTIRRRRCEGRLGAKRRGDVQTSRETSRSAEPLLGGA